MFTVLKQCLSLLIRYTYLKKKKFYQDGTMGGSVRKHNARAQQAILICVFLFAGSA